MEGVVTRRAERKRAERRDVLGRHFGEGLRGELALREELADEAVIGRAVRRLNRVAGLVLLRERPQRRVVAPARKGMEARAAEHHHRMEGDLRDDQEWAKGVAFHGHSAGVDQAQQG